MNGWKKNIRSRHLLEFLIDLRLSAASDLQSDRIGDVVH